MDERHILQEFGSQPRENCMENMASVETSATKAIRIQEDEYDGDVASDDELAVLMPTLKRSLQAFDREKALDFMGAPRMSDADNCKNNNKENAISSFRQFKRRPGTGRVTTSRPINFDILFAKNKTMLSPPSGSLLRNITTALMENVNRDQPDSQSLDDFWFTERQRKVSAVARRKLTRAKTPEQREQQPAEDRRTRHARSRRGGGNSRKLRSRPVKLDLYLDAARISEWDKETLAVEEDIPYNLASAAFPAGQPDLKAKISGMDEVKTAIIPATTEAGGERELGDGRKCLHEESSPNQPHELSQKADSLSSLLDMDLSSGDSPLTEEHDGLSKAITPDLTVTTSFSNGLFRRGSVCKEAIAQGLLSSSGLGRPSQGSHGDQAELVNQGPLPAHRNLRNDPSAALCEDSSVPNRNLEMIHSPGICPTPPSDPVADNLSLRCLKADFGELCQRRLSFLSTSSSEADHIAGSWKVENLDFNDVDSLRDLCNGGTNLVSTFKDDMLVELQQFEEILPAVSGDAVTLYKDGNSEVIFLGASCDAATHDRDDYPTNNLLVGEPQTSGEILLSAPCDITLTEGNNVKADILVDEFQKSDDISLTASCDGVTLREDDNTDDEVTVMEDNNVKADLLVVELQKSEDISLTASCDDVTLREDDNMNDENKAEEVQADKEKTPERHLCCAVEFEDSNLKQVRTFKYKSLIVSQAGDALLAISQEYQEEDDVDDEEPGVEEPEQVHHISEDMSQADQILKPTTKPEDCKGAHVEFVTLDRTQRLTDQLPRPVEAEAVQQSSYQNSASDEPLRSEGHCSAQDQCQPMSRSRRGKRKIPERRLSLEDGGSIWKDGQRRSQRRRVRPLEWWRGEKLLYGRVHQSLTTIIGIKYSSPGQYARGVNNPFTVESYVPAKYNELVRLAAI